MLYNVLYLIETYNFHVGSFLWIILHHGVNLTQSCEKNVNFQHLEKILSLGILTFQNEILNFLFLDEKVSYFYMSWWIVIFETWFWSKSQSLTFQCTIDFSSVDWNSAINQLILSNVLSHAIRSKWCICILEIMS